MRPARSVEWCSARTFWGEDHGKVNCDLTLQLVHLIFKLVYLLAQIFSLKENQLAFSIISLAILEVRTISLRAKSKATDGVPSMLQVQILGSFWLLPLLFLGKFLVAIATKAPAKGIQIKVFVTLNNV